MNDRYGKVNIRNAMRGVTLMELMIVVVIVGLLAMVAYPSYREYAARAKRNEARAALLQIATMQERFYLQNNTYTNDMSKLGFASAGPIQSNTGSYEFTVVGADANGFIATADYLNPDAEKDKCNFYQIDGSGTKISLPYTDCWTRTR